MTTTSPSSTSTPIWGTLSPPNPPGPPTCGPPTCTATPRTAPPSRNGSRGWNRRGWPLPLAARGSNTAPPQQAQEPRAEPRRGAEEARGDWGRDWQAIPEPLGGEALPLVMEVYGSLSWATSGTTRGLRNQPFDTVRPWRDGGDREVPPGAGWPGGIRKGSSGPWSGWGGPTGCRGGWLSWKREMCPAHRALTHWRCRPTRGAGRPWASAQTTARRPVAGRGAGRKCRSAARVAPLPGVDP